MAVRERSACYLLPTAFPSTFYHFVTPARFPADPSAIFLAEGGCASGAERLPVTPARFERAAYSLEGCCSIQLSYGVVEIKSISNFLSVNETPYQRNSGH